MCVYLGLLGRVHDVSGTLRGLANLLLNFGGNQVWKVFRGGDQ